MNKRLLILVFVIGVAMMGTSTANNDLYADCAVYGLCNPESSAGVVTVGGGTSMDYTNLCMINQSNDFNGNNITAYAFYGDGSGLTNISSDQVTDIWVNETGDTMTGQLVVQSGNGQIVTSNSAGSIDVQDSGGGAGSISFGNTADIGISNDGVSDTYDYDGSFIIKQKTSNPAEIGEFIFIEENGNWRFALPSSGADYGTYNPRSMIIAGPSLNNASNFYCSRWGFNHLDCDTSGTGADLGVQDDLQILGNVNIGENLTVVGNISADTYFGDGSQLTGISGMDYTNLALTNQTNIFAENATFQDYIQGKIDCSNITGGSDGDFCADQFGSVGVANTTTVLLDEVAFVTSGQETDNTADCGNIPCWSMGLTSGETEYTWKYPDNITAIGDIYVVALPDTTEELDWDCYSSVVTPADNWTLYETSTQNEGQDVTINEVARLNITNCTSKADITEGNILGILFESDQSDIHAVGLEIHYQRNATVGGGVTIQQTVGGGSMDYTNVALINKTNTFNQTQKIRINGTALSVENSEGDDFIIFQQRGGCYDFDIEDNTGSFFAGWDCSANDMQLGAAGGWGDPAFFMIDVDTGDYEFDLDIGNDYLLTNHLDIDIEDANEDNFFYLRPDSQLTTWSNSTLDYLIINNNQSESFINMTFYKFQINDQTGKRHVYYEWHPSYPVFNVDNDDVNFIGDDGVTGFYHSAIDSYINFFYDDIEVWSVGNKIKWDMDTTTDTVEAPTMNVTYYAFQGDGRRINNISCENIIGNGSDANFCLDGGAAAGSDSDYDPTNIAFLNESNTFVLDNTFENITADNIKASNITADYFMGKINASDVVGLGNSGDYVATNIAFINESNTFTPAQTFSNSVVADNLNVTTPFYAFSKASFGSPSALSNAILFSFSGRHTATAANLYGEFISHEFSQGVATEANTMYVQSVFDGAGGTGNYTNIRSFNTPLTITGALTVSDARGGNFVVTQNNADANTASGYGGAFVLNNIDGTLTNGYGGYFSCSGATNCKSGAFESAYVHIGNAGTINNLDKGDGDLYVEDDMEVDGDLFVSGTVSGTGIETYTPTNIMFTNETNQITQSTSSGWNAPIRINVTHSGASGYGSGIAVELKGTGTAGLFGIYSKLDHTDTDDTSEGYAIGAECYGESGDTCISYEAFATGGTNNYAFYSYGGDFYMANTNSAGGNDPLCWDNAGASLWGDCSSLLELKENVEELQMDWKKYLGLNPVTYNWKENGKADTGFIAEEIEEVMPELATYSEDGELVGYDEFALSAVNTKAIQELKKENDELKERIKRLEEKLNE